MPPRPNKPEPINSIEAGSGVGGGEPPPVTKPLVVKGVVPKALPLHCFVGSLSGAQPEAITKVPTGSVPPVKSIVMYVPLPSDSVDGNVIEYTKRSQLFTVRPSTALSALFQFFPAPNCSEALPLRPIRL